MQRRQTHRRVPYLVAVAALLAAASGCTEHQSADARQQSVGTLHSARTPRQSTGPLPAALHGMDLTEMRSGSDAAAMVERLHEKDVAPEETYIGYYGTGPDHAMLYVSLFGSGDEADSVLREMSSHIGEGSSPFGHHKTFAVDGTETHLVLGQGQMHFFFVRGDTMTWLGMSPDMARVGLAQLLEVPVEKVPPLDSLVTPS